MDNTIGTFIRDGLLSIRPSLASVPLWAWATPFVLLGLIVAVSYSDYGWLTSKPTQEIAAPVVIGLTAALAVATRYWVRQPITWPLLALALSLFARELHFVGTNTGFYVAFVVIVIWPFAWRDRLMPFLKNDTIRGLLSAMLLCYLMSKVIDRSYLAFLPDFSTWHHHAEETLETLSHGLMFWLTVNVLRIGVKTAP